MFTGKRLCWSLFLVMLQAWRPVILFKRDSSTDIFIGNLMTHMNREIDDIYFEYNTLCLYRAFRHFFHYHFC